MTVPLTLPVTTRFPTAAVDHPADDFFFNVVQQSDNCDRLTHLGRVVIFTANFLDEDFFISLSKWSAHRVGIAQLTQCCVFSRSSLREAHLRWPSLRVRGVPGKKAVSASQRASRPRLPLECSHGHWHLGRLVGPRARRHQTYPSRPPSLLTLMCVQLPFELGTSRLEFSSATSCVQNLVYKISKGSR